jgi:hypothetical protein
MQYIDREFELPISCKGCPNKLRLGLRLARLYEYKNYKKRLWRLVLLFLYDGVSSLFLLWLRFVPLQSAERENMSNDNQRTGGDASGGSQCVEHNMVLSTSNTKDHGDGGVAANLTESLSIETQLAKEDNNAAPQSTAHTAMLGFSNNFPVILSYVELKHQYGSETPETARWTKVPPKTTTLPDLKAQYWTGLEGSLISQWFSDRL